MGIDCMGMGGNGNVKSHSRTCLVSVRFPGAEEVPVRAGAE